jgi:nucleoid-associated protein YgaU
VAPEAASIPPVEPVVEPSPAAATPRAEVPTIRAVAIDKAELARTRPGRIIVRRGDTLWDIADRVYGSGTKYQTIYRANRHVIPRPGKLLPGQVLEIPLVYD